jgi:hypothetical protein
MDEGVEREGQEEEGIQRERRTRSVMNVEDGWEV